MDHKRFAQSAKTVCRNLFIFAIITVVQLWKTVNKKPQAIVCAYPSDHGDGPQFMPAITSMMHPGMWATRTELENGESPGDATSEGCVRKAYVRWFQEALWIWRCARAWELSGAARNPAGVGVGRRHTGLRTGSAQIAERGGNDRTSGHHTTTTTGPSQHRPEREPQKAQQRNAGRRKYHEDAVTGYQTVELQQGERRHRQRDTDCTVAANAATPMQKAASLRR